MRSGVISYWSWMDIFVVAGGGERVVHADSGSDTVYR